MPFKLGVLGIDHGHIFGMLGNMMAQGCHATTYWTYGPAVTEDKFRQTFPHLEKSSDPRAILDDPDVTMVLIAAVPADRADLAIAAMRAGKDVMVDKPGCTTLEQLAEIRAVQAETGRIWTVNFSERFEVPAMTKVVELVQGGAIGRVVQTVGLGPHKQNLQNRPEWFFKRRRFGGILCDIGSHQIEQFLYLTGSDDARVTHAFVENSTMPQYPEFQDFGEMGLRSDHAHGYVRVDWFTPNSLPTWGDGRLFVQGTNGYIEVRKYTDIGRDHVTNNIYLVNAEENSHIDGSNAGLPYFPRLAADVQDRSSTAVDQTHTFSTMRLAIEAQMWAESTLRAEKDK